MRQPDNVVSLVAHRAKRCRPVPVDPMREVQRLAAAFPPQANAPAILATIGRIEARIAARQAAREG